MKMITAVIRSIPLATWLFFVFGLEDTMFYALQGYLPPQYWGVSVLGFWEPSLNLISFFNLLGLVTILLFTLVSYRLEGMFHLIAKDRPSKRIKEYIEKYFK